MVQRDTIDNGSGGTRQNEIGRVNTPGLNSLIQESATKSNTIQIPEITLPKGGGALKGEKRDKGTG